MRVQLSWLREHVELAEDAAEVGRRLTTLGFPPDAIEGAGDDAVLDVDVGSNRPDALSHRGLARELAASLGRALSPLGRKAGGETQVAAPTANAISVEVEDAELCPRYMARVVRGVKVGASPPDMARRLLACGIRPINAVVDVTNLVLLDLGHPLHAFDLGTLHGRKVVVRPARAGERLTTLDGVERGLDASMLCICDSTRPVALAGIMGGSDTEIRPATSDVLLESAMFAPRSIRKTSRTLGLRSEASLRFERGTDRDVVPRALDAAAELIASLCGGRVLLGSVDVSAPAQPLREVRLRHARIKRLLGVDVPHAEVARILGALGFGVAPDSEGWIVTVPSHRGDVSLEVDLIEEVLRLHGFDAVPSTLPSFRTGARPRASWETGLSALRASLASSGWHQAVTLSMEEPASLAPWAGSVVPGAEPVALDNPLSESLSLLRTSLVPALLRAASLAFRRGERDERLVEESRLFISRKGAGSGIDEPHAVALVAMGRSGPAHFLHRALPIDVLAVSGALLAAIEAAGAATGELAVVAADVPGCAPGAAEVRLRGERLGWVGRIHPERLASLEITTPVFAAEALLAPVLATGRPPRSHAALPRYPNVVRDLSVLVARNRPYSDILALVEGLRARDDDAPIESFELVDRWLGRGVPEGKVSLTFSVSYRHPERTLLQDAVDRRHAQLVDVLVRGAGAELRA